MSIGLSRDCSIIHQKITKKPQTNNFSSKKFQQIDNRLIISNAQVRDSGHYICRCISSDGDNYESTYELEIEDNEIDEQVKPKVEYADVGSNVVLRCNSDFTPARYQWSKKEGELTGHDLQQNELHLTEVQAKDAGTYVCSAKHNSKMVEIPTILVVTGAIPYFPQAPKSYMTFPKLEDSYMRFNIEITFKPEKPDGLILYNGQFRNGGDYVALSLNNGYPEFRFDFGNEPTVLRADEPITMGEWHTVKINRIRKDGFMVVDNQRPIGIPAKTRLQGLDLIENLYLGGVPKFEDIAPTAVEVSEGFVGCISRLVLKERQVELNQESIYREGTTSCEPCAEDPCKNDGVCLEAQSKNGYQCNCMPGFTGPECGIEGESCTPTICGTGRCVDSEMGFECLCPLNKAGKRCEYNEHLDEHSLSFRDGSYAAYKTPKSTKMNIKFKVRPENTKDGVVLYVAESENGIGDFAAVVIKDKFVEFRFNTGARLEPVVIKSLNQIKSNEWTDVTIGRRHGEGYLQVGGEEQVTGKHSGPARSMFLKTNLFIGGYDKRLALDHSVGVARGFDGCISGLEIQSQAVDMIASILDAVNIQSCGEATNNVADVSIFSFIFFCLENIFLKIFV